MARRAPKSPNPFTGTWRIVEMEQWDRDYIDLEGPGFIKFAKAATATLDLAQFKVILIFVSRAMQRPRASSFRGKATTMQILLVGVDGQF